MMKIKALMKRPITVGGYIKFMVISTLVSLMLSVPYSMILLGNFNFSNGESSSEEDLEL